MEPSDQNSLESKPVKAFDNLPDEILHKVFSGLVIFEDIGTTQVSRNWRDAWATMPILELDLLQFLTDQRIVVFDKMGQKFKDFINGLLTTRLSSKLFRFKLSCYRIFEEGTISRWIVAVSVRKVEELELSFDPMHPFKLPHSLVTCDSLRVLSLTLYGNVLKLPNYAGFTKLTFLNLDRVELDDEHLARRVFTGCPVLETLNLVGCIVRNMEVLEISSTSMKNLTINSPNVWDDGGYGGIEIQISCPNLALFHYEAPIPRNLSLNNVGSLEIVDICFGMTLASNEFGMRMFQIIENIPNSTVQLRFDENVISCMTQVLENLESLSVTFPRVKTLSLGLRMDEHHVLVMTFLLECCTNLEALNLVLSEAENWCEMSAMQYDEIACLESKLKLVRVTEFHGYESELKLVKILLNQGHVLEKIEIVMAESVETTSAIISETILDFPKSSPDIAVIVLDSTAKE